MEDAHETIAHFDGDPAMSFFAVYDGHGGIIPPRFVTVLQLFFCKFVAMRELRVLPIE